MGYHFLTWRFLNARDQLYHTCYGWNTASGLRSGARATAGGGRSGERVVAAARLRMRARVLLQEADALVDVLRVPVDGRHRDAGSVIPFE